MENNLLRPEQMFNIRYSMKSRKLRKVMRAYEENTVGATKQSNSVGGRMLNNPYYKMFRGDLKPELAITVTNIISGVCNLDHYSQDEAYNKSNDKLVEKWGSLHEAMDAYIRGESKDKPRRSVPLSQNMCRHILTNQTITTGLIMDMLYIGKRQAQRYLRACKMIVNFLEAEHTKGNIPDDCFCGYVPDDLDDELFDSLDDMLFKGDV